MDSCNDRTELLIPPVPLRDPEELRASRPNEVILILTTRCNQACAFCCEPPGESDMGSKQASRWLAAIAEAGIPWVDFSGGEPLLHSDAAALLRKSHSLGLRNTLSTNGLLLAQHRDAIWQWVSQWNLSLHGDAELHDRIVGRQGSFQKTMSTIELVASRGGVVHLTFVTTPQNVIDVAAIAHRLKDVGTAKFCVNYVFRRGRGREVASQGMQSWVQLVSTVRGLLDVPELAPMLIYHNLNLDGQCILIRSTGEVWGVPMSNEEDFMVVGTMDGRMDWADCYPYIENHRRFTWPRLAELASSDLGYSMEPQELWEVVSNGRH